MGLIRLIGVLQAPPLHSRPYCQLPEPQFELAREGPRGISMIWVIFASMYSTPEVTYVPGS